MKNKILYWENQGTIEALAESLKNGNASITSTDTVLGLMANVSHQGVETLDKIKKRSAKSYIVLINSIDKLELFTDAHVYNKKLEKLIKHCWPGPVTLIFKSKNEFPKYLESPAGTIAIRIPNHPYLLQLLTFFDGLFSTSANISGEPIPEQIDEVDSEILKSVNYIVLDKFKENYRYPLVPSTIIDCTQDDLKVIREGAFPLKKFEDILKKE